MLTVHLGLGFNPEMQTRNDKINYCITELYLQIIAI